ncbi:MAG: hypothetical protein HKN37_04875 [Rhodothermales bacterium]|nr:hypothetical protein [Rhodothermales bacterium]
MLNGSETMRELRLACLLASLVAVGATGCERDASTLGSGVNYHGLVVDVTRHVAHLGKEKPTDGYVESTAFGFDIFDASGRRTDMVWGRDPIVEWTQFRQVVLLGPRALVLQRHNYPDSPGVMSPDEYVISNTDGGGGHSCGKAEDSEQVVSPTERTDLVYVFEDGGVLSATYDEHGQLVIIQARHDRGGATYWPNRRGRNRFAAFQLPGKLDPQLEDPPANPHVQSGLGAIVGSTLPSAALLASIVVHHRDDSRQIRVAVALAESNEVRRQILCFTPRPYDERREAMNPCPPSEEPIDDREP